MKNFIVIAILVLLVVLVSIYLYKSKKRGRKCIGCPYADSCSKNNCK